MQNRDAATWYKRRQRGFKIHSFILSYHFKTVRVNGDILYKMYQGRNELHEFRKVL